MRFNYTKTFLILIAAQFAIRVPLTFLVDAKPFVSGGVFGAAVTATLLLIPIGLIMDFGAAVRRALQSRRASALR